MKRLKGANNWWAAARDYAARGAAEESGLVEVPMVRTAEVAAGYDYYEVPKEHDGSPITRAVGKGAGGATLGVRSGSPVPVAKLEARYSDGERFWVLVSF